MVVSLLLCTCRRLHGLRLLKILPVSESIFLKTVCSRISHLCVRAVGSRHESGAGLPGLMSQLICIQACIWRMKFLEEAWRPDSLPGLWALWPCFLYSPLCPNPPLSPALAAGTPPSPWDRLNSFSPHGLVVPAVPSIKVLVWGFFTVILWPSSCLAL